MGVAMMRWLAQSFDDDVARRDALDADRADGA